MFEKHHFASQGRKPLRIFFMILVFIVIISVLAWLIMFLWNNILTETTGVKPLNFWKAAGLLLLAKILFGGIRRRSSNRRYSIHGEWREKWMHMSQEERMEARARWKEHCKHRVSHPYEEE
jgi:hypothetical protein